jgi:TRAP-type C4-dicarboxylate transport system substrate-binding protein
VTLFIIIFYTFVSSLVSAKDTFNFSLVYGDPKSEFSEAYLYDPDDGWFTRLEKESKGRIKIDTVYYAGQLIADPEVFDAAVRGTADIAINTASHTPGRFPVIDLISVIPFGSDCLYPSAAVAEVWNKYPKEYEKGFEGTKMLATFTTLVTPPALPLATTKKPIRRLEDLKGLRVTGPGKYNMDLLKALGVSPVLMPPFEQYTALQKGIIEAAIVDPIFYSMFSLQEVLHYQSNISFYGSAWYIVMNEKKWNSLPKDLQDVFIRTAATYGKKVDTFGGAKKEEYVKIAVKEHGLQIINVPNSEMARIRAIEESLLNKYIAGFEKKGLPAQAIWDAWIKAREENNH